MADTPPTTAAGRSLPAPAWARSRGQHMDTPPAAATRPTAATAADGARASTASPTADSAAPMPTPTGAPAAPATGPRKTRAIEAIT